MGSWRGPKPLLKAGKRQGNGFSSGASRRNQPCGHLGFRLVRRFLALWPPELEDNQFALFVPGSRWQVVRAAPGDAPQQPTGQLQPPLFPYQPSRGCLCYRHTHLQVTGWKGSPISIPIKQNVILQTRILFLYSKDVTQLLQSPSIKMCGDCFSLLLCKFIHNILKFSFWSVKVKIVTSGLFIKSARPELSPGGLQADACFHRCGWPRSLLSGSVLSCLLKSAFPLQLSQGVTWRGDPCLTYFIKHNLGCSWIQGSWYPVLEGPSRGTQAAPSPPGAICPQEGTGGQETLVVTCLHASCPLLGQGCPAGMWMVPDTGFVSEWMNEWMNEWFGGISFLLHTGRHF